MLNLLSKGSAEANVKWNKNLNNDLAASFVRNIIVKNY